MSLLYHHRRIYFHREEPQKEKVHFQHQVSSGHHQDTPPKDEHHEENGDQNPFHRFGKIGCLVCVWILMVGFLTSTPEKTLEVRQIAVPIAESRIYNFPELPTGTRINATFAGAFQPLEVVIRSDMKKPDLIIRKNQKQDDKEFENYIRVYLQSDSQKILTQPKVYAVVAPHLFDTTNTTKIPIMFDIGEDNLESLQEDGEMLQLVIQSNFTTTPEKLKQEMPLTLVYDIAPINRQIGVLFAAFVLIFLYALIIWEVSFIIPARFLTLCYTLKVVGRRGNGNFHSL